MEFISLLGEENLHGESIKCEYLVRANLLVELIWRSSAKWRNLKWLLRHSTFLCVTFAEGAKLREQMGAKLKREEGGWSTYHYLGQGHICLP